MAEEDMMREIQTYSQRWERKSAENGGKEIYGRNKEEIIVDKEVRKGKIQELKEEDQEESEDKQIKIRPANVT